MCKICGCRSSVKIKSCTFLQRFWVRVNMGLVNLGNQGEFLWLLTLEECTSVWFHTDTSATTQILLHFDMLYKSCMWNENCGPLLNLFKRFSKFLNHFSTPLYSGSHVTHYFWTTPKYTNAIIDTHSKFCTVFLHIFFAMVTRLAGSDATLFLI